MKSAFKRPTVIAVGVLMFMVLLAVTLAQAAHADTGGLLPGDEGYRTIFDRTSWLGQILSPRVIVWVFAQMHLNFAAFVLAVPMFAYLIEVVGSLQKDKTAAEQYDKLAHEFTRLLAVSFSITAIFGAVLTMLLIFLYPKVMGYMIDVFGSSMYLYALIFFLESFSLYLYYYGWGKISKKLHLVLGLSLNVWGIVLLFITNAWVGFMMSPPKGFSLDKQLTVADKFDAFTNFLWNPINIHRLIANLCLGGSVVGAYAAYRFLSAKDDKGRAYYDRMGFIGNFVAILALMPLPFAGYYLAFEIYAYNGQMGITMMGGVFSWLFIVQAVLIAALFLGMNHYLWLGMDRIEGSERYRGWIKWMLVLITLCGAIWATPKSLIATAAEVEAMGGTTHPSIGKLGVMSAKNTAVNLIILCTLLSFVLYRRGNKQPQPSSASVAGAMSLVGGLIVSFATALKIGPLYGAVVLLVTIAVTFAAYAAGDKTPNAANATPLKIMQAAIFGLVAGIVIYIGIHGYFISTEQRISLSPYQAGTVGVAIVLVMVIDIFLLNKAKDVGRIRWGKVSKLSQYMLIFVAISFTWLMGLMGYLRSGLRLHYHVWNVMEDTSPDAFIPTLGFATTVVSVVVLMFFLFVGFVFWIAGFAAQDEGEHDSGSEHEQAEVSA